MNIQPLVALPAQTFAACDRIGRYRIERVIGEGGMGLVLLARQIDLDMEVAIKVIRPELAADERVIGRLLEEARAVASLRSDHVVRVYDVARLRDGTPYLVFELVAGPDLDRVLAEFGPMSVRDAVAVILDVCQGLAEAHRRGIVHRDIKPENLLVERLTDGTSRIKISDFGIAKRSYTRREISLTLRTESLGSPWYMSPEQITNARDIDPRADVWSTGIVLYEILTGAVPFPGDNPGEVCARVLTAMPIPILSARPDLPPELEDIITRCLQKERSRRYSDVGELALDLVKLAPEWASKAAGIAARLASEDVALGRTLTGIPVVLTDAELATDPKLPRGLPEPVSVSDVAGMSSRWPYVMRALALVAGGVAFFALDWYPDPASLDSDGNIELRVVPVRIPVRTSAETFAYELPRGEPSAPLVAASSIDVPRIQSDRSRPRARRRSLVSRERNERPDYEARSEPLAPVLLEARSEPVAPVLLEAPVQDVLTHSTPIEPVYVAQKVSSGRLVTVTHSESRPIVLAQ